MRKADFGYDPGSRGSLFNTVIHCFRVYLKLAMAAQPVDGFDEDHRTDYDGSPHLRRCVPTFDPGK